MRGKFDIVAFSLILGIGSLALLVTFAINSRLATSQLIFWLLGLLVFFIGSHFDYRFIRKLSVPFFVLSVASLLLLFLIGDPVRGSVRWFNLGFFRVQPSEIAKVATIFLLGSFFLTRSASSFRNLLTSLLITSIPAAMVFKQPDLGNALSFLAIWGGMSIVAGMRVKHILLLVAFVGIFSFVGFEFLNTYQRARIQTFLNPNTDPLGTGYNVIQSQIAVGSGQLFGRGLGRGSQSQLKFLPEAESDFMFASITEQLGFFGASLLIGLYAFLVVRMVNITMKEDRFGQLLIAGICSFLIFQFMTNVGMNVGLLPVTGITLPLVSYGGSSLVSTLSLLGIAFAIKRQGEDI